MPLHSFFTQGKQPLFGALPPIWSSPIAHSGGSSPSTQPGSGKIANWKTQAQEQDLWCWAALTSSVSHSYQSDSPWEQCSVASAVFRSEGVDCCDSASVATCNRAYHLDSALAATGNFLDIKSGVPGFDDLAGLIGNQNPPCLRIEWQGIGQIGHFIALIGWERTDSGVEIIEVADPDGGMNITVPFDDLVLRYRQQGHVTHTYWTKPERGIV